jgi:murein DD-endopeptidase MepM/ murein hydrolase activator NlpD
MANRVKREILRQGKGRDKRHVKAALETARVEANFGNPSGGDSDSGGWRQERRRYYKDPTNIRNSVARFYREAKAKDRGQHSWELAADVQRPAKQYRGRYKGASREAESILRRRGTSTASSNGDSGVSVRSSSKTNRTFDKAGYQKALRGQTLARMFADNKGGSVLTRTGALSSAPVDKADFSGSKTTKSRRVTGSQGEPSKGGKRPGKRVLRGKVIGTPYAGTHTVGNWQSDNAVDIAEKPGTPVRSTTDGVVVKVGGNAKDKGRFGGIAVTIKGPHGGTFYTHLRSSRVRVGQRVRRGDILGGSGVANGVAHLHYGQERGDPRKRVK